MLSEFTKIKCYTPEQRRSRTDFSGAIAFACIRGAKLGNSDKEISSVLGMTPSTLSRWKKAHPSFGEAMADARRYLSAEGALALMQRRKAAQSLLERQAAELANDELLSAAELRDIAAMASGPEIERLLNDPAAYDA